MEVEGPEDQVVFLERAVNKDACGQASIPGIVPDGKSGFDNGYSLFLEENVCVDRLCEHLLKLEYPK